MRKYKSNNDYNNNNEGLGQLVVGFIIDVENSYENRNKINNFYFVMF